MRLRKGQAVSACSLALSVAALSAASAAGATTSRVVGHTYVNDNAAVANTVAAFDRHADGT